MYKELSQKRGVMLLKMFTYFVLFAPWNPNWNSIRVTGNRQDRRRVSKLFLAWSSALHWTNDSVSKPADEPKLFVNRQGTERKRQAQTGRAAWSRLQNQKAGNRSCSPGL